MHTFQEMIRVLTDYWAKQGCLIHQGYDLEVGAGTFNPATFLRCLGPEPTKAVYVEPSRRPGDGRYGKNPNRVQFYHQMQVIFKPFPEDLQERYLESLRCIGLDLLEHDIRFVHDDWENPTIGAWGLGWEIWADGMEVSQYTYFQSVGGLPVELVSGEITYGLERLAMYLQGVDSIFDLQWNDEFTYGELFQRSEWEWSFYNFEEASPKMWLRHFDDFEKEAQKLIEKKFPIPAYDFVMKASHAFNLLDARGLISVSERAAYISRIRALARAVAGAYLESREAQGFPLLRKTEKQSLPPPPEFRSFNPGKKADFLFEIGSEELPSRFVPIGIRELEQKLCALLKAAGLVHGEVQTFATPRRLAICISDLPEGTTPTKIERKGPSLSKAFTENGQITKAGEGFFRSVGLTPMPLEEAKRYVEIRMVKEIPYLFAKSATKGVSTRTLLIQELPKLIGSLDFPKTMQYGPDKVSYPRPLRWIVALYGEEVIPFHLGNLTSGNTTFGHRFLAPDPLVIPNPDEYSKKLRDAFVLTDVEERKATILDQIETIESKGWTLLTKERVLPEVLYLTEWPQLIFASFDKEHLQAPRDVLISEMIEHQKVFPVADAKGDLAAHFVITSNNPPTEAIHRGNRNALVPRLADGRFLFEEDQKESIDVLSKKLGTITFLKEVGSMKDKSDRLVAIGTILFEALPLGSLETLQEAAALAKADLASHLVGEFPELQGKVGRLLALSSGKSEKVALAIEEHWMPRGEHAPLPESQSGILLSLADKIDNLLVCFALGKLPTSSSDPFALRRQALGLQRILLKEKLAISLPALLNKCAHLLPIATGDAVEKLLPFLQGRLSTLLLEEGFAKEEIHACLSQGASNPFDLLRRLTALTSFRKDALSFAPLQEVYVRSKKLLQSQFQEMKDFPSQTPQGLVTTFDQTLCTAVDEIEKLFESELCKPMPGYSTLFEKLITLQKPMEAFFDNVRVLDEDPVVRQTRLGMLASIWQRIDSLADLTHL